VFSKDDFNTISRIISVFTARAGFKITLDGLLADWQNLTHKISIGYDNNIYEYMNDLSVRDLLEELMENVSEELRNKIMELVKASDEAFYNVTVDVPKPLLAKHCSAEAFWWKRIPKILKDELEDDLKKEGII
jgi:hypothetical protein